MWPVSLCMLITVILVRLLNPDGSAAASNAVVIASVAYNENVSCSAAQKPGPTCNGSCVSTHFANLSCLDCLGMLCSRLTHPQRSSVAHC
jgi:hypothetical protein